jgi:hypothetical protein
VKKVEIKGGAGREYLQGSTALNCNSEFRKTLEGQHIVKFLFLYGGGYSTQNFFVTLAKAK